MRTLGTPLCVIMLIVALFFATPSMLAGPSLRSVRDVDFLNFTYPWPRALRGQNSRVREIRLRNGEMPERPGGAGTTSPPGDAGAELRSLTYADVTGDGHDEALLVINVPVCCHGWGINCIYIFGLRDGKPRLLFSFADGDRAHGGLRDLYATGGELLIELWGKGSVVGRGAVRLDSSELAPACCATVYTRGRYRWNGATFRSKTAEVLANPDPKSIDDGYGHLVRPSAL